MHKVIKLAEFLNGIIAILPLSAAKRQMEASINEDCDNGVAILDRNNGVKLVKTFWIHSR